MGAHLFAFMSVDVCICFFCVSKENRSFSAETHLPFSDHSPLNSLWLDFGELCNLFNIPPTPEIILPNFSHPLPYNPPFHIDVVILLFPGWIFLFRAG